MQKILNSRNQTFKRVKLILAFFSIEMIYILFGIYYIFFIQEDKTPFEEYFVKNFDIIKKDLIVVKQLLKYVTYIYIIFSISYAYLIYNSFSKLYNIAHENYKTQLIHFVKLFEQYILLAIILGAFSAGIASFEIFYPLILNEENIYLFLCKIMILFISMLLCGSLFYTISYTLFYFIPYYLLKKEIKKHYVQIP